MAIKLIKRHCIIIDAYEELLDKYRSRVKDLPNDLNVSISLMDLYAQVAEKTGYKPDYCGAVIRQYVKTGWTK